MLAYKNTNEIALDLGITKASSSPINLKNQNDSKITGGTENKEEPHIL